MNANLTTKNAKNTEKFVILLTFFVLFAFFVVNTETAMFWGKL